MGIVELVSLNHTYRRPRKKTCHSIAIGAHETFSQFGLFIDIMKCTPSIFNRKTLIRVSYFIRIWSIPEWILQSMSNKLAKSWEKKVWQIVISNWNRNSSEIKSGPSEYFTRGIERVAMIAKMLMTEICVEKAQVKVVPAVRKRSVSFARRKKNLCREEKNSGEPQINSCRVNDVWLPFNLTLLPDKLATSNLSDICQRIHKYYIEHLFHAWMGIVERKKKQTC